MVITVKRGPKIISALSHDIWRQREEKSYVLSSLLSVTFHLYQLSFPISAFLIRAFSLVICLPVSCSHLLSFTPPYRFQSSLNVDALAPRNSRIAGQRGRSLYSILHVQ
uniref:Uncharacterized protein n=1 Tax=Echeneis naucrates TaxID=173247 RepID=A0A665UHK0_ECHNA